MRYMIFIFLLIVKLFSSDATMVVSNEILSLPKLKIVDKSTSIDRTLKDNFYSVLKSDFMVSAAYDVSDNEYDFIFEYNLFKENNLIALNGVMKDKSGKIVYSKKMLNNENSYVFLAHNYIVDFAQAMGFDDLSWMRQKVVFSQKVNPKKSNIIISDYTLSDRKIVISNGLNIFPKWCDNTQTSFYYSDYTTDDIVLYKYNLLTGEKVKILNGKGMLVVTDVNKDGSKIAVTMAPNDQPDIYIYDINSKKTKKVTNYHGIDVSGKFAKDDSAIVFVSDRFGYPNVFIQNIGQGSVEPLVYKGKNNSSIGTYGDYVVYSSRDDSSTFNLYLMSLKNNYIRQLTANGKNIFPKFSHNGNSILFIKTLGGQNSITILRINQNLSFNFALKAGMIHSIDW